MTDDGIDSANAIGAVEPDALSREVYCILGIPVDAVEMPAVLYRIKSAAAVPAPFLLSTPNLNFLIQSRNNPIFREAVLRSDLSPPDGFPIVWIARITGIPIKSRVSGSDIFEALKAQYSPTNPLRVFLFGGHEGVAAKASSALNAERKGLRCVGALYPGFGTVEEISQDGFIETINSSNADFLIAALGADKGQRWLLRNHSQIRIPIRAHLGAVLNFQAGSLRRAPLLIQRCSLEWLWRIKEEPYLWRRYWKDGWGLLSLLPIHVLPLAAMTRLQRLKYDRKGKDLIIKLEDRNHIETVIVRLEGVAISSQVQNAIPFFREVVTAKKGAIIDASAIQAIDARFLGLLFMFRKRLHENGVSLAFTGVSSRLERMFRLNGAAFLLAPDQRLRDRPDSQ